MYFIFLKGNKSTSSKKNLGGEGHIPRIPPEIYACACIIVLTKVFMAGVDHFIISSSAIHVPASIRQLVLVVLITISEIHKSGRVLVVNKVLAVAWPF